MNVLLTCLPLFSPGERVQHNLDIQGLTISSVTPQPVIHLSNGESGGCGVWFIEYVSF